MVDDGENGEDGDLRIIDELEFEPVTRQAPKKSLSRAILLTLVLLVAAGGVGWYFVGDRFKQWFPEDDGAGVPFIRADETPVKARPKNPGGMDIPNRDKLIYGRLRGAGDAPPVVERLMPSAESPRALPKPESPRALPKTKAVPSPVAGNNKPSADMTKSLEAAVSSLNVEQPKVPPASEVVATAPPVSPPPVAPSATDKKIEAAKSSGFKIQVGAVRSTGGAESEWQRLKRKNPELLGKIKLFITKADLGPPKGIFYRLRAGPIADEATARELCKKLTRRKVGCLVVRPGE